MKKQVITNQDISQLQRSLVYSLYPYDSKYKQSSKFVDISNININFINISRRERADSSKTNVDLDVVLCQEDVKYKQMVFNKSYVKIVSTLTGTLKNDSIVITCNIFLCLKENQDLNEVYTPYEDFYIKDIFKLTRKAFFKWIDDLNTAAVNGHCPRCGHIRFDASYITKHKVEYDKETENFVDVCLIYEPSKTNGNDEPAMIKCENCGYKIKSFLEE